MLELRAQLRAAGTSEEEIGNIVCKVIERKREIEKETMDSHFAAWKAIKEITGLNIQ
jgi:hypothetical protein